MDIVIKTPIRWLLRYITDRFKQTNEHFFDLCKELVKNGKLQQIIRIDNVHEGFSYGIAYITPEGQMTYNECFLCYLWCMCYYGLVSYEKAIVIYQLNKQNGTNETIDKSAIHIAEMAHQYAMSMVKYYSEWPSEIPTPQDYDNNEDVRFTNQLFLYAINYIMCHETAHIVLGHKDGIIGKESFTQELDADIWAFKTILTPPYKDSELTVHMGILMGLCSMIMSSPRTADGQTHPSSFKRLNAFLNFINPAPESQLYAMASLYIGVWDITFSKSYDWIEQCDNYKEMYNHIYHQIIQ